MRRRRRLWDLALRPLTIEVSSRRKFTKLEGEVFVYLWSSSAGPGLSIRPGRHNATIATIIKAAREPYREEMKVALKSTSALFEAEAVPVYDKLLADKHGAMLCAMRKKAMAVEPHEMTHDRFQPTPTWAQEKDIAGAIKHLTDAGIFRSDGEIADLLQQGRHRLFGNASQKGVFAKHDTLQFWMGMVTLYMIGIHEQAAAAFDAQMQSFAEEGEFHAAPGVKGFDRIMTKAFEYMEEFDCRASRRRC